MIPKNFDRENFTPARRASLFHCLVWFDIDQREGVAYTSWRNELYKVNSRMKVVAHPSAFKALKDMLNNFSDVKHNLYRPFTRAEIYENFNGTTLLIHDGIKEINTNETFKPVYETAADLKLPGKHRLITGFESVAFGNFGVPKQKVIEHLNFNWKFYNEKFNSGRAGEGRDVAA